tara:strand:+ start:362 stop:604 length:243 start_codon:yes stop_codon:yes gene_type:complete
LRIKLICNKKRKINFWKKLEREKMLKKKPRPSNKNSFLDFKRWRTRCWLVLKPLRLLRNNKNNLERLRKNLKKKRKFNKI